MYIHRYFSIYTYMQFTFFSLLTFSRGIFAFLTEKFLVQTLLFSQNLTTKVDKKSQNTFSRVLLKRSFFPSRLNIILICLNVENSSFPNLLFFWKWAQLTAKLHAAKRHAPSWQETFSSCGKLLNEQVP